MFIRLFSFIVLFHTLFVSFTCYGRYSIKGTVVDDSTDEAIAGANVYINHSTMKTITGEDGGFEVKVPMSGAYELIISSLGYQTKKNRILFKTKITTIRYESLGIRFLSMGYPLSYTILMDGRDGVISFVRLY